MLPRPAPMPLARHAKALFLSLALLLAMGSSLARATEESWQLDGRTVALWRPTHSNEPRLPLIIFSHGFHGCATQSRYLTSALAEAGYLVVAPNHRDATCNGGTALLRDRPQQPFAEPGAWDQETYRDRAEDIRRLVAALSNDERLGNHVDWSHIALAGHSLGGYTVLGLAGAWDSWRLPAVRAVLALSPYTQPFLLRRSLSGVTVPVMFQGGTHDFGITPALSKNDGAFALARAPKYYVEFDRAGHLAWTDVGEEARAEIIRYSLAFLDHYLKSAPAALLTAPPAKGVVRLHYASELGHADLDAPTAESAAR
jgi:predicted dienelactone hydrolase